MGSGGERTHEKRGARDRVARGSPGAPAARAHGGARAAVGRSARGLAGGRPHHLLPPRRHRPQPDRPARHAPRGRGRRATPPRRRLRGAGAARPEAMARSRWLGREVAVRPRWPALLVAVLIPVTGAWSAYADGSWVLWTRTCSVKAQPCGAE